MNDVRPTERDDRALIIAFQQGDERAFDEIVRRYHRQVSNILFLMLGNREDVRDQSQEVFLKVHRTLGGLPSDTSLFSWIYRIAVNSAIDELRRKRIRRVVSLDFLADSRERDAILKDTSAASDEVLREEKRSQVSEALNRLSSEHKAVLILREYQELSYKEIAETLKISVAAVKSRIFRARDEMKYMLKNYFKERS